MAESIRAVVAVTYRLLKQCNGDTLLPLSVLMKWSQSAVRSFKNCQLRSGNMYSAVMEDFIVL
jgi:hypothetical protein